MQVVHLVLAYLVLPALSAPPPPPPPPYAIDTVPFPFSLTTSNEQQPGLDGMALQPISYLIPRHASRQLPVAVHPSHSTAPPPPRPPYPGAWIGDISLGPPSTT
ncbi:hypothetical protein F5Y03DRAFT_329595 [Xylaria venustula]|nr:hypothetical protein F5Y03DRAFT_329595 [Xylaria venustula]